MMVVIGRACLIMIIEDVRGTRDLLFNIVTISSFGQEKNGHLFGNKKSFISNLASRNELYEKCYILKVLTFRYSSIYLQEISTQGYAITKYR